MSLKTNVSEFSYFGFTANGEIVRLGNWAHLDLQLFERGDTTLPVVDLASIPVTPEAAAQKLDLAGQNFPLGRITFVLATDGANANLAISQAAFHRGTE